MFIFWGSYKSEKKRGVVADHCPTCAKVQPLTVTEYHRVAHLYGIPLPGSGTLLGTVLKCIECGGLSAHNPGAYARFVPEKEAKALTTGALLEQTNPQLAESIATRVQLERDVQNYQPTPGMPDPRVKLAFAKLAEFDPRDRAVIDMQAKLAQWAALDSAGQSALLCEIDTLLERKENARTIVGFIRSVGQRFKPDVSGGLGFAAFIVTVVTCITAVCYLFPKDAIGFGILGSLVAGIVLWIVVQRKWAMHVRRRFYRNEFFPELENRGIDLRQAYACLAAIDPSDERVGKGVRGLVRTLPILREVAEEKGVRWEGSEAATNFAQLVSGIQSPAQDEDAPAKDQMSLKTGVMITLVALLLVVALICIAQLAPNPQPALPPQPVRVAPNAVIDREFGFQLNPPGGGWSLLSRDQSQLLSKIAFAGARGSDDLLGVVLVEKLPPNSGLEGRIVEHAKLVITNVKLADVKVESEPAAFEFHGRKAARFQYSGTNSKGERLRVRSTMFARDDLLYQVRIVGSADKTNFDDGRFREFEEAFVLTDFPKKDNAGALEKDPEAKAENPRAKQQ
jgi:hypothetical protein